MIYYVLFGLFAITRYGKSYDGMRFCVIAAPLVWLLALFIIHFGYTVLEFRYELNQMDCDQVKKMVTYMRMSAMMSMKDLLNAYATILVLLLFSAAFIMVYQVSNNVLNYEHCQAARPFYEEV